MEITPVRPGPGFDRREVETDARGEAVLSQVREGVYDVRVSAHGGFAPLSLRGLELDAPRSEPTFRLRRGATISGRVIDSPRGLLQDARAHLEAAGRDPRDDLVFVRGRVSADGSFRFEAVGPGEWRLCIEPVEGFGVCQELSVEDGVQTLDREVVYPPLHSVRGRVVFRGRPLDIGHLALVSLAGSIRGGLSVEVPADGSFVFHDVPEVPYRLSVQLPDGSVLHHRRLAVREDADLEVRIRAATVSGQVVDTSGLPLSGAELQIAPPVDCEDCSHLPIPSGIRLDRDGRFELGPLEAGSWTLRLAEDGYETLERTVELADRDVADLVLIVKRAE